jgi:hypothetical protein
MTAPTVAPRKNAASTTQNGAKTQAPMPSIPFARASRKKTKQAFNLGPFTVSAAVQALTPIQIPPGGFLQWVDLLITCTTAGNAATVVFAADSPFNVLQYVDLRNSAGDSLIVPFNGYQLYLINKYGCLSYDAPYMDPRRTPAFFATAGAGATGGSFQVMLRVPLELDPRDAFPAVPNLAANKSYQLQLSLNNTASLYTTPPTTPGTVTIFGLMGYWSQPNQMNASGVNQEIKPLGNGSVSLWRYQPAVVAQGDRLTQLLNVGNVIRTAIFTLRTAAGARTSADWPATSQIILNDDILFLLPTGFWSHYMACDYGYNTGAIDAAGGLDTGVFVVSQFMNQRGAVSADGPRDQFLVTYNTTLLQLRSTVFGAAASSLEIITNELKPVSALALYSPNLT